MQFEYEFIKHHKGLPFFSCFVSVDHVNYHWHADLELMCVLKGAVSIHSRQGDYKLFEGDVFIVNTYEVHTLKHLGNENLLLGLQINTEVAKSFLWSLSEICFVDNYIPKEDNRGQLIKYHMAKLMISLEDNEPEDLLIATSELYQLLSILVNGIEYEKLSQNLVKIKQNDFERLQGIITYVNNHYKEKIRLQQIADMFYISKYHLSHFIKDKLGIGFQDFLNRVRLSYATEAIAGTDKTIVEIAESCGFSDVKYLNKLIKEEYNCTPLKLREYYKKNVISLSKSERAGHFKFDIEEGFLALDRIINGG